MPGLAIRVDPGDVIGGLVGGAMAAVLSGAPSTAVARATGRDTFEAIRAAGSLVGSPTAAAGLAVHTAVSLGWGIVLAAVLPRRRPTLWGVVGGGAISLLDLGLVGRRFAPIRALPMTPQVADHLAYGAVVGAVVGKMRVLTVCRSR